jgi:hypothetical protein
VAYYCTAAYKGFFGAPLRRGGGPNSI